MLFTGTKYFETHQYITIVTIIVIV